MSALPATECSDIADVQTSVVQVTSDMFEQIYPLLYELNPKMPKVTWKHLFDYEWGQEEKHKGLALVCNGQYVGFLGMIFSVKQINGELQKFCNLACWYVQEPYRNQSLSLILPVMGLKKHTIKNLTPTPTAHAIFSKLGFKELEKRLMILPLSFSFKNQRSEMELLSLKDLTRSDGILNSYDQKLLHDHQGYRCDHLVIRNKNTGEYCYILATKVKKKCFDFAYVHYMSNKSVFWENIQAIQWHFFKTYGTPLTLVDERHDLPIRKVFCFHYKIGAPKLFRSTQVKKEDIDHLYSELFLLNF